MSTQTCAIVITHNSAGHAAAAVNSCLRQNLPVVLVDNASTDTTLQEVPSDGRITVIPNASNRGFAGAVNQAAKATRSPFLLLLNPDAQLLDAIEPLVEYVKDRRFAAAAGLLLDPSGQPQRGFSVRRLPSAATLVFEVIGLNCLWPGNPINRRYRCEDLDLAQPQRVEQPAGACLLFRRDDWEELGGFDESFHPIWFEDVDFCNRLLARGGSIWFEPAVRVRHSGAHSIQTLGAGLRQQYWHVNLLRYASKHFSGSQRRLVARAVLLAAIPRCLVTMLRESPPRALRSFIPVWRSAWRAML